MKRKLLSILMTFVLSVSMFVSPVSASEVDINPPTKISIKTKTESSVKLSWNKVEGAEKYVIYYSTQKNKGYKKYGVTSKTSLTVKKLEEGTTYYFRIKARDITDGDVTNSKFSSAKKCTTKTSVDEVYKGIVITEAPGTIFNNSLATITIKGKPNTEYTCKVMYSSGWSTAEGLGKKTSDSNGIVSWTWKVGRKTKEGEHPIKISGGGETLETSFWTVK